MRLAESGRALPSCNSLDLMSFLLRRKLSPLDISLSSLPLRLPDNNAGAIFGRLNLYFLAHFDTNANVISILHCRVRKKLRWKTAARDKSVASSCCLSHQKPEKTNFSFKRPGAAPFMVFTRAFFSSLLRARRVQAKHPTYIRHLSSRADVFPIHVMLFYRC